MPGQSALQAEKAPGQGEAPGLGLSGKHLSSFFIQEKHPPPAGRTEDKQGVPRAGTHVGHSLLTSISPSTYLSETEKP